MGKTVIMEQKWIIGVLADLRNFAECNNLPLLAQELDGTLRVARAEIASVNDRTTVPLHGERLGTGKLSGAGGACAGS